jgi:hypothetical protein
MIESFSHKAKSECCNAPALEMPTKAGMCCSVCHEELKREVSIIINYDTQSYQRPTKQT